MILSGGVPVDAARLETLADATPVFANGSYYANRALPLEGLWASYGALYKHQLWVGVVVRKLSNGTARLPFEIKRAAGPGTQPEGGPLTELLTRPQERLSGFRLWQWTSSTFDVYGEAFWLKERDQKGRVRGLRPIHPTNIIVRRGENGMEYVYTTGLPNAPLLDPWPEDDIVAFTTYSPDTMHRGVSNLEGLRMTLLNEDASRRATASFWRRGARPSVALQHPGELSDKAQARIKTKFESVHGGADNAGGVAVLEEGMTANVLQLTAEEMQYIESRKLNREEVCAAYDVPPPVVHILDHATYSNITEQMRSMYRDTMAPRLEFFESVIDHSLVPDFYGTSGAVFTKFNMDDVLRGDFENRAKASTDLVNTGIMKPSEARPMFGLDDAGAVADQLYGNAALVPLGSSVHGQQEVSTTGELIPSPMPMGAPKPPPPPPAKQLNVRAISGRLGRVKAAGGDVRKALVDEHRKGLAPVFDAQREDAKAQVAAGGDISAAGWDDQLAGALGDLGEATARSIGNTVAKSLGGSFDVENVADWLRENSVTSAADINTTTVEQLKAYLAGADADIDQAATVDAFFDGPMAARADTISGSRVAMVASLASLSAAGQVGAKTKTWRTGPNPRSRHAELDGETVPLGELFSNGMDGPGDPAGGADEVANCNCTLDFNMEAGE